MAWLHTYKNENAISKMACKWWLLKLYYTRCTICDALRDLVPFVQFETLENTHGGWLLLVKLQAFNLQLY